MDGNILFLVCSICLEGREEGYGVKLAERSRVGWYEPLVPKDQLTAWLANHRACGGRENPDHFQLAYLQTVNGDQGKPKH